MAKQSEPKTPVQIVGYILFALTAIGLIFWMLKETGINGMIYYSIQRLQYSALVMAQTKKPNHQAVGIGLGVFTPPWFSMSEYLTTTSPH
jgi:hypothetical protein